MFDVALAFGRSGQQHRHAGQGTDDFLFHDYDSKGFQSNGLQRKISN